jgi:hypothetical protein
MCYVLRFLVCGDENGCILFWAADPTVKFVREALTKAGCPVADKFFKPEQCSMKVGGGFKQDDGVWS